MVILSFVAVLAYVFLLTILSSFVFSTLWSWFVVSFGLPEISIAHAFGLMLMLTMYNKSKVDKTELTFEKFAEPIVRCFVILLLGYIAKQYV